MNSSGRWGMQGREYNVYVSASPPPQAPPPPPPPRPTHAKVHVNAGDTVHTNLAGDIDEICHGDFPVRCTYFRPGSVIKLTPDDYEGDLEAP